MKYYDDLRSFITALDEMGDIAHVTREVDCDYEPSAITRRSYETQSPAPLFHNVAGVAPAFACLVPRRASPPAPTCPTPGLPCR